MARKTPPVRVQCQECGKVFRASGFLPECPACGGSDIDLAQPVWPALVTD